MAGACPLIALLPQRAPFLFVQRVVAVQPQESIHARGPFVPGMQAIEALGQTAYILAKQRPSFADHLLVLASLSNVHFAPLRGVADGSPHGLELDLHARFDSEHGKFVSYHTTAFVGGEQFASASVVLAKAARASKQ